MTRKDELKMLKLSAENAQLRAQVEKCMQIYREQVFEIVDMKVKLDLIAYAMSGGE